MASFAAASEAIANLMSVCVVIVRLVPVTCLRVLFERMWLFAALLMLSLSRPLSCGFHVLARAS